MTALAIDKPRSRAWWKELWIQVLIAMAAGIALGIVNPQAVAKDRIVGPHGQVESFVDGFSKIHFPIHASSVLKRP